MAPYMGDVETIAAPLVLYRMHGANDSAMSANTSNFGREIARALKRHNAACKACTVIATTSSNAMTEPFNHNRGGPIFVKWKKHMTAPIDQNAAKP